MKGWQFTTTHAPLQLVEKEDPKASGNRVVIDVKAAGLCHSDVSGLTDENWLDTIMINYPIIMGHEVAGIITEIGEDVTDFKVGDRVALCPVALDGSGFGPGFAYDGGFGTKVCCPAEDLVLIPENVSFAQAAAATDAGMTSYHALFGTGGAKAGMKVGIIGVGGLGQIAARAAIVEGCDVYVADLSPAARELAEAIGIKPSQIFEDASHFAALNLPLIIDYAGFGVTTATAVDVVAPGGRVVLVGMGKGYTEINTTSLILKKVQLHGSVVGSKADIEGVLKLMSSGDLNPLLVPITFEEIPEGLKKLENNEVKGRLVAVRD
ncbi:alcohol dehydrogenase catalytic domain-containing protein [Solibacillus silvestris]